jgi:hypothetical protein
VSPDRPLWMWSPTQKLRTPQIEGNKFAPQIGQDPQAVFAERPIRLPTNWREINLHPKLDETSKSCLWRHQYQYDPLLEEERFQITPKISEPPNLIHNWTHPMLGDVYRILHLDHQTNLGACPQEAWTNTSPHFSTLTKCIQPAQLSFSWYKRNQSCHT